MRFHISLISLLLCCFILWHVNAGTVSYDGRSIIINGQRKIILSGAIHYPRSTPEMWPDLISKAKEGGLDAIETYIFWNAHEPLRRQYDFSGNLDLVRFFKVVQEAGLHGILRIGPYICAEWNYGGIPMWLHKMPNMKMRTNNQVFKDEMQNFTTLIINLVREANLFASQGGPIILAQIENEFGDVEWAYGDEGKEYIKWCVEMALSQNISEPWIMCQQRDAPYPMIDSCNGYYGHDCSPNRDNVPKIIIENWIGWSKSWGGKNGHRTAEDLAYSVARFYQTGGVLQNYYMYHGGTNFGRTAGPYITTSYDFDAAIDEYGNLNQPKWGHIKQLHAVLHKIERFLTDGQVQHLDLGNNVTGTMFTIEGNSSCFLTNANNENDAEITFQGNVYKVPAWSVSILPDCQYEEYNTAKVNTQTSIMIKEKNIGGDELKWEWKDEVLSILKGHLEGTFMANMLLDQKDVTNDTSDYLWYITSVPVDENDSVYVNETILRINTTGGQVIHAFLNEQYIGSKWAIGDFGFVFEEKVQFIKGSNQIALLSVTVGHQNYGPFFDEYPAGITGSVQLVVNNTQVIKDLSANQWIYKVGIDGEKEGFYKVDGRKLEWNTQSLPENMKFVWYKTKFKAPEGTSPVVVDLKGLGKGLAWVNGMSIGRYWPCFLASTDGCTNLTRCDYRGYYSASKCQWNCGNPTQRWYHIPRSFLNADGNNNVLVLFEEFGGNLSSVSIQTVTVGTLCANAYEGNTLELACQDAKVISEFKFASFGDPRGSCGSFEKGDCEARNTFPILVKACIGKENCRIDVGEASLGSTGCKNIIDRLAIEAVCN